MAKRSIGDIGVETGADNVFAYLELPDADKLRIKSGLVVEITGAVRGMGLTQDDVLRRIGIGRPKVSWLLRGESANVSERKLMDCLNRLGYDIEIQVRPAIEPAVHLRLAIV